MIKDLAQKPKKLQLIRIDNLEENMSRSSCDSCTYVVSLRLKLKFNFAFA